MILAPPGRPRWTVHVVVLCVGLLWPACSMGQAIPVPAPSPTEPAAMETAKPTVTHAMEKGVTFKVGTALMWAVIGLAGTGSVIDAGVFSIFSTASSYTVYVANDYVWDHLSPPVTAGPGNTSFDTAASAWRNTWKYLTFKPAINVINMSALYLYTGSVGATVAMGGTAFLAVPVIFYANNMAWDWYDFRASAPAPAK
jgi:uncharacterized membrane protein